MPNVIRDGAYRLFFYSNEGNEPPHVHVEDGDNLVKFWLDPVSLAKNDGFSRKELGAVTQIVVRHRDLCLEKWREHFE